MCLNLNWIERHNKRVFLAISGQFCTKQTLQDQKLIILFFHEHFRQNAGKKIKRFLNFLLIKSLKILLSRFSCMSLYITLYKKVLISPIVHFFKVLLSFILLKRQLNQLNKTCVP